MSRPSSRLDEKEVNQNGDPMLCASLSAVFTDTHSAAVTSEMRLLSAFKKDNYGRKVFLAGKGLWRLQQAFRGPAGQNLSGLKELSGALQEFHNEKGTTFDLHLVGKLKQQFSSDPTVRPEYPPPLGLTGFTQRVTEFTLGRSCRAVVENRVLGIQTPGFTAAVRLGAELLRHWHDISAERCGLVYLPSPCDDSLADIFRAAGVQNIRQYHYWDDKQRGVCLEKLLADLEEAPEKSVVVLSASAHYPTGADLSRSQWVSIVEFMMRRRLFPLLLLPAQGLCYGDLERDAWPVRYCASHRMELVCAQSLSHSFGLYGEAVGHLLCILKKSSLLLSVQSQADKVVRSLWAQPSDTGARVVATVLSNPAHLVEWQGEVKHLVERCMLIREILRQRLRLLGTPGCWDHLIQQRGLFCCMGLNGTQLDFLSKRSHVYLLPSGCLNVSAINGHNLDYIAESIHLAVTTSL